jgi:hypothetical protein
MEEHIAKIRVDIENDEQEGYMHYGAVIYVILQKYCRGIDDSQLASNCI